MKIIVDKEGSQLVLSLCDIALRAKGLEAFTMVKDVEASIALEQKTVDTDTEK